MLIKFCKLHSNLQHAAVLWLDTEIQEVSIRNIANVTAS